jgi:hypothetical protein
MSFMDGWEKFLEQKPKTGTHMQQYFTIRKLLMLPHKWQHYPPEAPRQHKLVFQYPSSLWSLYRLIITHLLMCLMRIYVHVILLPLISHNPAMFARSPHSKYHVGPYHVQ